MFTQKVESPKGEVILANVNTKDFLPAFLQAFADSALLIQETLETFWLVQKAEMYLTDAKRVISTGLTALGLVKAILDSVVGFVFELTDTSFYTLFLTPETGGMSNFVSRFKYHLFDAQDPDRPYDEGSAVLLPLFFLVSYADIERAKEAFSNLKNLFGNFKDEGKGFIKEFTEAFGALRGMEDTAEPAGFWDHYYTKRIVGSRKKQIDFGSWNKVSLMDMMPEEAILMLQDLLDSWSKVSDGTPYSSSLVKRTEAIYAAIFASIKEVVRIIDGYTRLFLDNQLTLIKAPPIEGEVIKAGNSIYKYNKELFDLFNSPDFDYSGVKPAVQVLSEFVTSLPDFLRQAAFEVEQDPLMDLSLDMSEQAQEELFGKTGVKNPFSKESIQPNFTNFLRNDSFVGGMVIVFKSGSLSTAVDQAKAFLSLFGVSL